MADDAKNKVGELEAAFIASGGQPVMLINATIKDVEYAKTSWRGQGDGMEEYELPRDEWHTRVDLMWVGGNRRLKLPPSLGDVSKEIEAGKAVLAILGYQDKRGQLKPDAKRVELVGCGLGRYDNVFQNFMLSHGGS